MIKPQKLEKGDTVATIAPSSGLGGLFPYRVDNARKFLESIGFKVKEFPTVKKFVDGNAGTIEERLLDIHSAFKDKEIKAIICNIGGLACNELLNLIDYNIVKTNPKIFCGYSDITLLHYAFSSMSDLITFYGPAAMTQFGEFPRPQEYTLKYFLKAVNQSTPIGRIEPSLHWTDEILDWSKKENHYRERKLFKNEGPIWIKEGSATGKIFGGCLYSILQLKGTRYDADYSGKILFVETPEGQNFEKGEPLNYVDSQITDLRNMGVFDKIKGLVVGRGFGYLQEERKKFKQIIIKHTKNYDFPVLFNVDIGHTDPMITIPLNVRVTLNSEGNIFSINESGVV